MPPTESRGFSRSHSSVALQTRQKGKESRWRGRIESVARTIFLYVGRHAGVGLVCSVAYFDPGNWGVDLQAGSQYGYRLLFVVLLAGLIAVFLQVLASRLGCVTGLDLASHCRLLLHSHPAHPRLVRWVLFYPLYVLAEVAIIATDLAELLGSAMALCMLFPELQLWHGVLITAFDVVFLLALKDPLGGKPVRLFELGIAGLVLAVLICMCIIISRVDVHWGRAFQGYLPSKYIFPNGALYTSVGIVGATVMPHSLFLGSALATQVRVPQEVTETETETPDDTSTASPSQNRPSISRTPSSSVEALSLESGSGSKENAGSRKSALYERFSCVFSPLWGTIVEACRTPTRDIYAAHPTRHSDWENRNFDAVRRHLYHGIIDVASSLMGIAVVINSLILILASAVFFYGSGTSDSGANPAGLFDAYDLIRDSIGQSAATLFAIALLASGQSSSIIATIAGQAVSEGFLRWRVSPVIRRLFTRLLAIIPSMAVAISLGRPGIDTLLVVSQVVLSVVLPFIALPLVYLTSDKRIMSVKRVRGERYEGGEGGTETGTGTGGEKVEAVGSEGGGEGLEEKQDVEGGVVEEKNAGGFTKKDDELVTSALTSHPHPQNRPIVDQSKTKPETQPQAEAEAQTDIVDFSNNTFVTLFAAAIWLVILAANVYVIAALGLGQGT